MRNTYIIFILFLFSVGGLAQPINPGADEIFRPNELAVIRLTLSPEDKAFLLNPDNVESEVYLSATFEMINSQIDTVLEKTVGVRLRGNTSRFQNKKPFKIDFREFDGEKFFGYKKFNLKPNTNDPSHFREPLTMMYYREMNIPAARTHPLRLYMNDEYMGVYTNVEQIDDEFLDLRVGHEEGFLYKCSYGANLVDDGQVFDPAIFESELHEDEDLRTELDHFVDVLNNTPDATFSTEIEKVFNVDLYLRQLAVESMLGHWDGYSYNKNNFYLYYNGQTQKIEFFPYDGDNTWGIDWVGHDWARRDLIVWAKTDDPRPLTKRILNVPAYNEQYLGYLQMLIENYFNEDYITPILEAYKEILDDAVSEDTYFDDSFGFTHSNFVNSFWETDLDNQVKYGILEYLQIRLASAADQLSGLVTVVEPLDSEVVTYVYPNPSQFPRVYFYSSINFSAPVVYSSTGVEIPLAVTDITVNDRLVSISFPTNLPKGLYLIKVDKKLYRWVYQ